MALTANTALSSLLGMTGSNGAGASNSASTANSWSNSAGNKASSISQAAAANANSSAMDAWREAATFNAEQARIQREWQERMSNTVYQRSVADMKAAGINPILAAQMGLSTASVGSGATASMSSPNSFMANTYPEQNSASTSASNGESWQNSESGLATALTQIAAMLTGALGNIQSGVTVNNILRDFEQSEQKYYENIDKINEKEDKYSEYRKKVTDNNKNEVGGNKFLQWLNNLQIKATYGN